MIMLLHVDIPKPRLHEKGRRRETEESAHLMVVLCHTTLQVAAAAQALQTLAAAARSLRDRWRKMSASTSSGSCSPGSAMVLGEMGTLPLPEALAWREGHLWAPESQNVEGTTRAYVCKGLWPRNCYIICRAQCKAEDIINNFK